LEGVDGHLGTPNMTNLLYDIVFAKGIIANDGRPLGGGPRRTYEPETSGSSGNNNNYDVETLDLNNDTNIDEIYFITITGVPIFTIIITLYNIINHPVFRLYIILLKTLFK